MCNNIILYNCYHTSCVVSVDFDQMMDQKVVTSDRKTAEETALTWLKVCIICT